jgi:hypothetical protein
MIGVIKMPAFAKLTSQISTSQRKDEGCPLTSMFVNREFEQFDARFPI